LFLPVVLFSWILPSMRTYTWHAAAAIAATSVYFLIAAFVRGQDAPFARIVNATVGVILYLIALSAYHATAVFLAPALLVLGVSYLAGWRPDRFGWRMILICLPLLLAAALFVFSQEIAYPFGARIKAELVERAALRPDWNWRDNTLRSWDNFFYSFFGPEASFPMRVLLLTGLCECLRTLRTSLFARTTLVLFTTLYALQWPLWGHEDWSQNCYTIIPIIGLILVALRGLENAVALIGTRWLHTTVLAVLMLSLSVVEYRHYFAAGLFQDSHYLQDPFDTSTQLTLALRDAKSELASGRSCSCRRSAARPRP
jgi:hypothetical protein